MIRNLIQHTTRLMGVGLLAAALVVPAIAEPLKVDEKLPVYKPVSGISGTLSSIGSDTIIEMMSLWQEAFVKLYPSVKIQAEGKGSSTAPPALIAGTAEIGPMSRPMKQEEIDAFEAKYGYKPTSIGIALDALAVFVSKDNPIQGLNMQQIDGIFSSTRKSGTPENIATWGQLGLTGDWANRPISLYGRNSASGTYAFFKEHALAKGDFKDSVKEQPGSSSVVNGVAGDLTSIGYSGIGYKTSDVIALPLAKEGTDYVAAEMDNVISGKYPLGRMLLIYVGKAPSEPLSPLVKEFLKFVLSKQGQEVVIKAGYLPLPATVAAKELKKLN